MTANKNKISPFNWVTLFIPMVVIALFFGLRPIGWSIANGVQRLDDIRGIRFQGKGIAYVADLREVWPERQSSPLTIEMAVTPGSTQRQGFNPILLMHDGDDRRQLVIWQYGPSLIVMNGDDYSYRRRWPRVVARDVFASHQTNYLTVTTDAQGTRLYVDGIQFDAKKDWRLTIPVKGAPLRLVLGNSIHGKHGWSGDLHGLAASNAALPADAVLNRYEHWEAGRNFDFLKSESPKLLYAFDQPSGARFSDASQGHDLVVPRYMAAPDKRILELPGKYTIWNRAAAGDMLVNVVGFMPLGIVFYGVLQGFSGPLGRHARLTAVAFCMLLSLGIELAQAWIPTRYSSLMDLILNSVGACLGVVGWELFRRLKRKRCLIGGARR
jgi:hypothetical protein